MRIFSKGITVVGALLLGSVAPAATQESCGRTEVVADGETLDQLAARCGTTAETILAANPEISRQDVRDGLQLSMPAAEPQSDWVGQARDALRDAGEAVEDAASAAGRSVSDYLSGEPDLNRDLLEFGERLGLPGVSAPAEEGANLNASPSRGAAGSDVTLTASGLPGNKEVVIGAVAPGGDLQTVARGMTDSSGRLEEVVPVPERVEPGEQIRFVVETADERVRLASEPFEVTSAE